MRPSKISQSHFRIKRERLKLGRMKPMPQMLLPRRPLEQLLHFPQHSLALPRQLLCLRLIGLAGAQTGLTSPKRA